MKSLMKNHLFFIIITAAAIPAGAQNLTREQYIDKYSDWAVEEMLRSGIPASVTLAQGLLESDNGNSTLAVRANNHFGIKCHGWKGRKITHDDDRRNECFRKYKSARESYSDHTDFLMNSPRYSFLFELEQSDYNGWAKGLKKAGYATAPNYASMLVSIIEENGLEQYDRGRRRPGERDVDEQMDLADIDDFEIEVGKRRILVRNRINYIIVKEGDTYQSLNRELDMMPFELAKYNEIPRDSKIEKGQVLYLQPKRNKASVEFRFHTVEEGESMYKISQMYGIKLHKLLQKNLMQQGDEPEPGDILHLRKRKEPLEIGEIPSVPETEEPDSITPARRKKGPASLA
jgi:LysM repeat protein